MIRYQDINTRSSIDRVLAVLEQATNQDIKDGCTWYNQANDYIRQLSAEFGHQVPIVAGVLSALSPGANWVRNQHDTRSILEEGAGAIVATYGANKRKAIDILIGTRTPEEALGTRKTGAFYQNLLHPNSNTRVTIDRHSSRCAHGYNLTPDQAILFANTDKKYQVTESIFQEATNQVPELFWHQVQAITWLVYRRVYVPERYHHLY
jgi:hypothetical protein